MTLGNLPVSLPMLPPLPPPPLPPPPPPPPPPAPPTSSITPNPLQSMMHPMIMTHYPHIPPMMGLPMMINPMMSLLPTQPPPSPHLVIQPLMSSQPPQTPPSLMSVNVTPTPNLLQSNVKSVPPITKPLFPAAASLIGNEAIRFSEPRLKIESPPGVKIVHPEEDISIVTNFLHLFKKIIFSKKMY